VCKAKAWAQVVIIEGYLVLDCSTTVFHWLDGLFWVEITKEQLMSRRKEYPWGWPSGAAYAEGCVWPAHQQYVQRAARLVVGAGQAESLTNAAAAPVLRLPAHQDIDQRASCALKWLQTILSDSKSALGYPMSKAKTWPKIIGISGASRSGKTTLTVGLKQWLQEAGLSVASVHQDDHRRRSSENTTPAGMRTWEGPQFTNWQRFETAVCKAKAWAQVVIIEGYLVLDCSTTVFHWLDGLFWVEITKEQLMSRRKEYPWGWPSGAAYAEGCVWPAHQQYVQRAARLVVGAGQAESLTNAAAAPVLRLPAHQDIDQRANCALKWLQTILA